MYIDYKSGFSLEIYGESHAEEVGVKIYGIEKGVKTDLAFIREFLSRRTPDTKFTTKRKESDEIIVRSGIEDGFTMGEPINIAIINKDIKKSDYEKIKTTPRPSTADYPAYIKYGFIPSGGGRFSGRMTAPLTVAGGILIQILKSKGIEINAEVYSVGKLENGKIDFVGGKIDGKNGFKAKAYKLAEKTAKSGDSLGGTVACFIKGLPVGAGGELFDGLESKISNAVFSVPSVKGVEFGSGFSGSKSKGSINNDPFVYDGESVKTLKNNAGGILGGMASGMPVCLRIAFKPVPSISKKQKTIDLSTRKNSEIQISGRHDSCILYRVLPVVESAVAIGVYSAVFGEERGNDLTALRNEIDKIDDSIATLLNKRNETVLKIKSVKSESGLKTEDKERENLIKERLKKGHPEISDYIDGVYGGIFSASKDRQK